MLSDFIHSKFGANSKAKNKIRPLKSRSHLHKHSPEGQDNIVKRRKRVKGLNNPKTGTHTKHTKLRDQIRDKIQEFIGHLHHAPDFVKDNEFIHTGYRINFHTPKKVLKRQCFSLFMVHNELVNVWSHLGGAIIVLGLCLVVCFSISSIDTSNLGNFVQVEVKELFEPIYERLPNFSELEHDFSEKISHTQHEITKFGEDTFENFELTLKSLSNEIEQAKANLTPEAVGNLLKSLKEQLETFSTTKSTIGLGFNPKKLDDTSQSLKRNLNELQHELIRTIDSSSFDWIDIYKYTDPGSYSLLNSRNHLSRTPLSRWPIIVFLLSAIFCLFCSALFHLFYCQNQRTFEILRRFDYAGISILITGSCFPGFVYGFYCQPFYSNLYLSIVGIASIIVFFITLGEKIHSEAYVHLKGLMYGGLGTLAGLPCIHLTYLTITRTEQNDNLNFIPSLYYYLPMGAAYLGGLAIYIFKCPERFKPGKFDILGHSHQIWHICVLLGVILTYFGAFDNYYTRLQHPCISCDN